MRVYSRRKLIKQCLVVFGVFVVFVVPVVAFAQITSSYDIALGTKTPVEIAVTLINWFLTLLALVAVVLIIYGGFVWMTAAGNEEKVKKAKKILISTGIGLLIILASWGIVQYVLGILSEATGTTAEFEFGGPPGGYLTSGNPFHINSTDPRDEEFGVPLCQIVTVGFSLPLDEQIALEEDGGEFNNFSLKIRDGDVGGSSCSSNADCSSAVCSAGSCVGEQVPGTIEFSESSEYLVFFPEVDYEENTTYRVEMSTSIATIPGEGGYALSSTDPNRVFEFTTGTTTDTEPPTVAMQSGFLPFPGDGDVDICREAPIQATFNESLDVTSVDNDSVWLLTDLTLPIDGGDITLTPSHFSSLEDGDPDTDDTHNTFTIYPASTLAANSEFGVNLYAGDPDNNFTGAIRDTCGNPLDGNFNGNPQGSHADDFIAPSNPSESLDQGYEHIWTFTTGETAECTPVIDSISPGAGFYSEDVAPLGVTGATDSDLITLSGAFLYPFTDLELTTNVSAAEPSCFDTDHTVGMTCVVSGTAGQVVVRTPVGSVTGPISIENESGSDESSSDYTVNSPFIYALSPASGPPGQFVSIKGRNFVNDAVGQVLFDGIPAELPCDDGWDDDQIIVQVPDDFSDGDFPDIQVIRADGRHSNFALFEVTSGIPGPGLCELAPDCSDTGLDNVTLIGEAFGDSGEVFFDDNEANVSSYSNDTIVTDGTPVTDQAVYEVGVVSGGANSNGLNFDVPCPEAGIPQVRDSAACDVDNDQYPSPNPRPGTSDACLEVIIAVAFENVAGMTRIGSDPGGVTNPDNFKLFECPDPSCTGLTADNEISSGARVNDPSNLGLGFRFYPSGDLQPGTTYQGFISGNVTSTEGVRMGVDYTWTFTTQAGTEACPLSFVDVSPSGVVLNSSGDSEDVEATPYGPNCTILSGSDYTWAWGSDNADIVQVWDMPSYQTSVRAAGGDRENEGVANISAEAESVSGSEPFTVDLGFCNSDLDCLACTGATCDEATNRCTPIIENVDPVNGAVGGWVTLSGCYFGPDPGSVELGGVEQVFPDAALCADTWSDDEVIFEVAPGTPSGPNQVDLTSTFGLPATGGQSFDLDGTVRPGVCSIDPDQGFSGENTLVTGKGFGTGTGACETAYQSLHPSPFVRALVDRSVAFYNTYVAPVRALAGDCTKPVGSRVRYTGANATDFSQWIENFITQVVPTGANTGPVTVRATTGGEDSNPVEFTVQCDSDADCGDGFECVGGICLPLDYCETDGDCNACAGSTCDEATHSCSPVIENISPDSGPEGRAVTVNGCYFGSAQGSSSVLFGETEAGLACGDLSWNNDYIIVTVPTGVTLDANNQTQVSVNKVVGASEFASNSTTFTETVDCVELGDGSTIPIPTTGIPVLCQSIPNEAERGDIISLEGDFYSGSPAPDGEVVFSSPVDPSDQESFAFASGSITSGTTFNHALEVTVPAEAPGGKDQVTMEVDSCPSNSIDVEIDARPFVKSTQPAAEALNVCRNAQVQITFSDAMDPATLTGNVSVSAGGAPVSGEFSSYQNGDRETVLLFEQEDLFPSDQEIQVQVNGDNALNDGIESGVLSEDGLGMDGTYRFRFQTQLSDGPCEIDRVEIDPEEHTFSEGGADGAQDFSVVAYSDDDQALSSTASYSWTWLWEEDGSTDIISIATPESDITEVTADANGNTSIYAEATVDGTGEEFEDFANITVFFCADVVEFESEFGTYDMETFYCQDDYSISINNVVEVDNPGGGALAEWFFLSDDTDDAIGLRIFGNDDRRLQAGDWFGENAPNPDAATGPITINGYDGIEVGRTMYVSASNFVDAATHYPNIYVFSFNQDANPETEEIFSDLLENLIFNKSSSTSDREKIRLATKRITDLGSMSKDLEEFYEQNGHYPRLESGTFVKYLSTSAWPSWESRLGNALGVNLPEDEENYFNPSGGSCEGANFESDTCFDSVASRFECPDDSRVYMYKVNPTANVAQLYARTGFSSGGWPNFSTGDDPCADPSITNSECSCFNYEISHEFGIPNF